MALIIENGTGVVNADSFVTVAECSTFAVAYFGASLSGSPADKEAALRRAYMFMGTLNWRDEWPVFDGTIPTAIKNAQHIFARAEFQNPNSLQPTVTPGATKVLNKVGELGWKVTGQTGIDAQRATVTMAMDLLKPYLTSDTNFLLRA